MKVTIGDHPAKSEFVDSAELLRGKDDPPGVILGKRAFTEDGEITTGKHSVQRTRSEENLSYDGCVLTVSYYDWRTDAVKLEVLPDAIFSPLPREQWNDKVKSVHTEVFDLKNFNPDSVRALAEVFDHRKHFFSPPDSLYIFDNGAVAANPTAEKDMRLYLDMEYPYAERFAKALKHAIEKCGGKPPLF